MSGINVGEVIAGKYRVERILGQGGMATVVMAKHLRLHERVAIKIPHSELGGRGDIAERLVREGRAAMRIRSEHLARVYDVGVLATGRLYLVMEYLEGRDLGAILAERGSLPIAEAASYVLQALEALAEAHARGVIHRDLKPSNLFLTAHVDGSPLIKVIDFGISKIVASEQEPAFTRSDAVFGSAPYMAPEQMRSSCASDARSDIWAVGATLHMLLTGRPPFLGGSMVEIHERIQRGPPALRQACPDATPELEAILLRCMDLDPAQRYANVADLAAALAPFPAEQGRVSAERTNRIFQRASQISSEPEGSRPEVFVPRLLSPLEAGRTDVQVPASWYDGKSVTTETVGMPSVVSDIRRDRAPPFGALLICCLVVALVTLGLFVFPSRAPRKPDHATLTSSQRSSSPRSLTTAALMTTSASRDPSSSPSPLRLADQLPTTAGTTSGPIVTPPSVSKLPPKPRLAPAAPSSTGKSKPDPLADPD